MNRLAGIIAAALGLAVAVLGIMGVVPGVTSAGVALILLGGLVIGLSFIEKPLSDGTPRMSTPSTLANIFFSPAEVFRNLRDHPRWLVAVIVMSLMSVVFTNAFLYRLTPERVTNYAIDKTLEMPMMNDQARQQVEATRQKTIEDSKNPVVRAGQAVSGFTAAVFGYAFLAVIFFLFVIAMGGKMNFWQAFSATVYAMFPVAVIRFVLNMVLLFIKDPAEIHPILGQQGALIQDSLNFLVKPSENPVLYTLLGGFSLLWFYWAWLNATGLKNAGERVTGSAAWTATIAVYIAMVTLGVVAALLFPSFIS